MSADVDLLLLAGRSGVGKSAVAEEISAQLKHARLGHALMDGDWLDRLFPQAPPDLFDQNFRALWGNYRNFGCRRLIYSNWASIRNADRLVGLMAGPGEVRRVGVLLTCDDDTARVRLTAREHASGLAWHLANLAALNDDPDLSRSTPDWAHRLNTERRTVAEVATEIVGLLNWA
ncbi:hypothetical protein [Microlunatus sp. GCM10028923]|uniref:hypothetical protein n=1 Tax=Microlunatus sp. GCM10028923 TaxID=3273400 RepID=UPI0036190963